MIERIDSLAKRIEEIEKAPMLKPIPLQTPAQPLDPYRPIITWSDTSSRSTTVSSCDGGVTTDGSHYDFTTTNSFLTEL